MFRRRGIQRGALPITVALLAALPSVAALAGGGAGGGAIFALGGAGGTNSPTGTGGAGAPGTAFGNAAGGGGGAGVNGGAGSANQDGSAAGGSGGTSPGGNGTNGANGNGFDEGAGGGGGGAHGEILTTNTTNTGAAGGNGGGGGTGGPQSNNIGGAGGGGGAGGYGVVVNGSGLTYTMTGSARGGNGGAGGASGGNESGGGGGGSGGIGVYFTGGGTVVNSGTIAGGNGGAGGVGGGGNGSNGAGGAGIQGSGLTIINNGTTLGGLSGDGVTRADAIIFTGGINVLTGTGTTGSFTMISGGTFAPGSGAAGTSMTIAGNLAFQSGVLYLVHVNPSAASSATASGTAALAGTVQASFAPGSYAGRSYDILHAAGGSRGTFSGLVVANLPVGFAASLSYTSTDVFLNLASTLGAGTPLNQHQQNVASAINGFFNAGGTLPPQFGTIFGLTGPTLAGALTQLSGEAATGAQDGAFQLMNTFLTMVIDPFVEGRGGIGGSPASNFAPERDSLPPEIALAYARVFKAPEAAPAPIQQWRVWGAAYGGGSNISGDPAAGTNDVTARTYGFATGADYHVTRDTLVGFALAGGGTNWNLAQSLGSGRSDAFQAGLYAKSYFGPAYVAASLAFANYWMSTNRLGPMADQLTAGFNAQSYGGRVEGGYRFAVTPVSGITPYAALQAQSFHTPAYSETDVTGGGFGLAFNARNATDTRSEIGARFDRLAAVGGYLLTLHGRLAWAHDFVSDPTLAAAFQALPGASFIVNGAAPAKDSALATFGADYRPAPNWVLSAKFEGELAAKSQTYAGVGKVIYSW